MRKIALLAAMAAFLPVAALAQSGAMVGAGQVWGNSTAARAPGKAENVTAILDRALGSTRGAILERGASGWAIVGPGTLGKPWVSNGGGADPAYQTLGIVGGGTNCAAASATCLDNITGFSSTGMMARTGAGAYSFRTITGTANAVAVSNGDGVAGNPTLSLPAVVNIATSLALNGCTIGANVFCASGSTFILSNSAAAFSVGANGATNPAFIVDSSTASQVNGLKVTGTASGGGVGLTVVSSATNEPAGFNAKGSGTITIANTSTGGVSIGAGGGGVTLGSALTYGGVTLSNSVTGTGSMVLSASPAMTGTPTAPTAAAGNNSTQVATTAYADRKIAKVNIQTFCPSGCTTTIAGGASGTYTASTGLLYAEFECWGGGGGGGGVSNSGASTSFSGGGGGAGSYSKRTLAQASIGSSLTVFIGTAGTAGANTGGNGGAGGDSCFTTSTCSSGQKVTGKGGSGGTGNTAVGATPGGAGGVVGTGDLAGAGQPGSAGFGSANTGTILSFLSSAGSSSIGGGFQGAAVGVAAAGVSGTGYAAGGSGALSLNAGGAQTGGAGAVGYCQAVEYTNQ